ncbi:MAG: GGDEF domain-containing response regulator [Rhodoferax sp.]|nr:GGDEF domain-containing response regulator [Rhodoferax sp.]
MISANAFESSDESDFLDVVDDSAPSTCGAGSVWRLLIVDDEPDVHRATTFALNGLSIFGRSLEFLHAYSAEQAIAILREERNIAIVLLDVVMEREDAGLALVKVIRRDLNLTDIRIILRTGQPGYAPEIETIHAFDINDYKTKSELTRAKLYATITSALRTYEQIRALDDLAFYDHLSRLPNRNRFIKVIDERLASEASGDTVVAILDIDDFSEFNDSLGHQQGDRLLQAVAQRLTASLGSSTVVARIGSNAFGLMGPSGSLDPIALLDLFHSPFQVQDDSMLVTATIGLVRLTDTNEAGRGAIKDANIALKRAKKNRRGSFVVYTKDMGIEIRERVRLLQGLRSAVDTNRLFVVYQPQVMLGSGQVVGIEALLRWRNDDGRFVPPERFIPLAEASGLIIALGDWVLRMACHELVRIHALGLPALRVSVNVSQLQFRNPDFVEKLVKAIADTGVDASCLELEITESVAMEDPDFMLERFAAIKTIGVTIAIDDFGTGYSSLSHLRQLPIDRLKIDRAFVNELSSDILGGPIAAMVIELGRNLNMMVIAEGVETEKQAAILREMGCHEGQGFFYSEPLAPPELKDWLLAHRAGA